MVKLRILIFLFLFCIFHKSEILDGANLDNSNVCLTPACNNSASILLNNIDPKVAPCDDFYKFACGNFTKNAVIPKDKSYIDRDAIIEDKVQNQLKISIEEKILPNEPRAITLAKYLYKACMNTTAIEEKGIQPVLDDFKKLGGWPVLVGDSWNETTFDWKQSTYNMWKLGYGTSYIFTLSVITDYLNSTKRVLSIDQPSLSIDREYLLKGFNNTIVHAYYNYMVNASVILGAKRDRAERELKDALDFEIELANISISEEMRSNVTALYNPMNVTALSQKYKTIPWKQYFNSILKTIPIVIGDDEVIIVIVPTFFEKFEKLINETQKRKLANYHLWRAAQDDVDFLNEKIKKLKMEFTTVLYGEAERKHRWKECLDVISQGLEFSIGALYVRKYFKQETKKSTKELAVNIEQHFKKNLNEAAWMDEKTRRSALDKIDSMKTFIGYPDELFNDKTLDEVYKKLKITPNDYYHATQNMYYFIFDYFFSQLRVPVNTSDWKLHSRTAAVDAINHLEENSIEITAGILQDIYFHKDHPQYLNYAVIGSTIGHEVTHGFDNTGRTFDKNGNLKDWWTPETEKKFLEKADCIIKQYGNYTVEEVGLKVNGVSTQDENIAGNGGLKVSYLAYRDWVKRNGPEPKLPGLNYSPSQLFWISYASMWCRKTRPEFLKNYIMTNPHSPAEFRVTGPLSNRPEFARDFGCKLGSKMNPDKKCSVW